MNVWSKISQELKLKIKIKNKSRIKVLSSNSK